MCTQLCKQDTKLEVRDVQMPNQMSEMCRDVKEKVEMELNYFGFFIIAFTLLDFSLLSAISRN